MNQGTSILVGYKKLKVWEEAHKLVIMTYKATKNFPKEELFGLTDQMKRSAVSVAANIVEGHAKKSQKAFLNFLAIANGSLVELEYYVELSRYLEFISENDFNSLNSQRITVGNLLNGFIKSIKGRV